MDAAPARALELGYRSARYDTDRGRATPSSAEAPPLGQIVHGPFTVVTQCGRHGVPFFERAYVGYVPVNGRVAEPTVHRMVQRAGRYGEDRVEGELAAMLEAFVHPAGVAVVLRSTHDCAGPRLFNEVGELQTTGWHGRYRHDPRLRAEFLARCLRTHEG